MKRVLIVFLIAICSISVLAQNPNNTKLDLSNYGISINSDKRLIAVLASLEAAGTETILSETGEEFRKALQKDIAKVNPDLRIKMKVFVEQFAKRYAREYRSSLSRQAENDNIRKETLEDFNVFFAKYNRGLSDEDKKLYSKKYGSFIRQIKAPFIAMAYSLSDVPNLSEPNRSLDLPDNLLEVLDFSVYVREFYKTKGMAAKIDSYYKMNQEIGNKMRPQAREMVINVLDYLHTRPELSYRERVKVESKRSKGKKSLTKYEIVYRDRKFQIVPEVFASKGTINFLNIKDNYFAIVPPNTDLSSSEVRRGFLQFVLDPLVLKSSKGIFVHHPAIKKLLDKRRDAGISVSPDPILVVSRSLVAAVDAREKQYRKEQLATANARRIISIKKTDAEKKKVGADLEKFKQIFADEAILQLSESYENGAVLAFYFAEKLKGIEDSGFDIASSLDDWIFTLKPVEESQRLFQYTDAKNRAIAQREKERTKYVEVTTFVENPLTRKLLEVEKLSNAKKFDDAEARLLKLLEEYKKNKVETSRIYYALGRLVSQSAEGVKDAEVVSKLLLKSSNYYKKVFNSEIQQADPALISSTYFALGRIYEFTGQKDYAIQIYDAALRIGDVEGGAFQEAFDAKNALIKQKDD